MCQWIVVINYSSNCSIDNCSIVSNNSNGLVDNNWWGWSSGTSAATAWVSGSLSLLLEEYPELQRQNNDGRESIEEVKNLLSQTSQMKDNQTEHDDYYGYGIMRIDLMINSKK